MCSHGHAADALRDLVPVGCGLVPHDLDAGAGQGDGNDHRGTRHAHGLATGRGAVVAQAMDVGGPDPGKVLGARDQAREGVGELGHSGGRFRDGLSDPARGGNASHGPGHWGQATATTSTKVTARQLTQWSKLRHGS